MRPWGDAPESNPVAGLTASAGAQGSKLTLLVGLTGGGHGAP